MCEEDLPRFRFTPLRLHPLTRWLLGFEEIDYCTLPDAVEDVRPRQLELCLEPQEKSNG